jgi:hypothetical protein
MIFARRSTRCPSQKAASAPRHRNVVLAPDEGMLILDVVGEAIACVEVLYRDEVRQELIAVLS